MRAFRHLLQVGVALAWCLAATSCATKIEMKPSSVRVGAGVDREDGRLLDPRDEFKTTDAKAVAWAEFENAYGRHTARFQWVNPEEQLVLDSGPIDITKDDQLYVVRRVWSTLPIADAPAQFMPGDWTVNVYFDDKKFETLTFELDEP